MELTHIAASAADHRAARTIQKIWSVRRFIRTLHAVRFAVAAERSDPKETALSHISELQSHGPPSCAEAVKTWSGAKSFARSFVFRMHHPYSVPARIYSGFVTVVLLYSVLSVPYRIGLSHPATTFGAWWWFDLAVDLFFLFDILVNFRTGAIEERGHVAHFDNDACRAAKNYLKFWFWIDLITSLPLVPLIEAISDIVRAAALPDTTSLVVRLPRLVRIVRILRLLKLTRLMKVRRTRRPALPPARIVRAMLKHISPRFLFSRSRALSLSCLLYPR
jgi:hypothetical protein